MNQRFNILAMSTLLVMTMTTTAFAQAVFRVSSGIEARARSNGYSEAAGDISLFVTNGAIAAGATQTGTVMIEYGVPITNAIGDAPTEQGAVDNAIEITVCGGDRLVGTEDETDNRASVSKDNMMLTIHVDQCAGEATTDVINIEGVLLSLVGSGADSITATVSNTGDVRLLNHEAAVIRSVVDPLTDDKVTVAKSLVLVRHTGSPPAVEKAPADKFMMVIEEAHVDSFEGATLNLSFSGIPENTSVVLDFWITDKANFDKKVADTTRIPADAAQNSAGVATVTGVAGNNDTTVTLEGTELPGIDDDIDQTDGQCGCHDAIEFGRRCCYRPG